MGHDNLQWESDNKMQIIPSRAIKQFFLIFKLIFLSVFLNACTKDEGVYDVSIVQLLAHPEDYIGKDIYVRGYLGAGTLRRYALYMSKEDFTILNYPASVGIWDVSPVDENENAFKYFNCFVTVRGRFDIHEEVQIVGIVGQPKINLTVDVNKLWAGSKCDSETMGSEALLSHLSDE